MSETKEKKHDLDFAAISRTADVDAIVEALGLVESHGFHKKKGEWVGRCPRGNDHGKDDSFQFTCG